MDRRTFITTTAATPLLATEVVATTITPDTPTKIQRLYSELKQQKEVAATLWREVTILVNNCGLTGKSLMEYDNEVSSIGYRETSKENKLAAKLMRAKATCSNDVLIKSIVTFGENECGFAIDPDVAAQIKVEAEAFLTHDNGVGTVNVEPTPDPMVANVADWFEVNKRWENVDTAGNFDEPECLELDAERNILSEQICTTKATSIEGLAAQLEYAVEDFGDFLTGNKWKDLDTKLFANAIKAAKSLTA